MPSVNKETKPNTTNRHLKYRKRKTDRIATDMQSPPRSLQPNVAGVIQGTGGSEIDQITTSCWENAHAYTKRVVQIGAVISSIWREDLNDTVVIKPAAVVRKFPQSWSFIKYFTNYYCFRAYTATGYANLYILFSSLQYSDSGITQHWCLPVAVELHVACWGCDTSVYNQNCTRDWPIITDLQFNSASGVISHKV